jgi:hypothetical protein
VEGGEVQDLRRNELRWPWARLGERITFGSDGVALTGLHFLPVLTVHTGKSQSSSFRRVGVEQGRTRVREGEEGRAGRSRAGTTQGPGVHRHLHVGMCIDDESATLNGRRQRRAN